MMVCEEDERRSGSDDERHDDDDDAMEDGHAATEINPSTWSLSSCFLSLGENQLLVRTTLSGRLYFGLTSSC
jgi:hypothetical protein